MAYEDQKQYEKGFEDGWKERDKSQVRCKDCKLRDVPEKCVAYEAFWDLGDDGYCNFGERKDEADTETLEVWNLDGSPVRIIKGQKDEVEE